MLLRKMFLVNIFYLAYISVNWFSDWAILRVSNLHLLPNFNDLRLVLASSDCAREYGFITFSANIARECTYNYGFSLVRIFHLFQINSSHANFIGFTLLLVCLFSLIYLHLRLNPIGKLSYLAVILVLMSPISSFLIERANLDVLIFLSVLVGCWLLIRKNVKLALLVIFLGSLIKFYTLPLLLLALVFKSSLTNRIFGCLLFLVGTLVTIHDIRLIDGNFPRNCSASFGNPVLFVCFREVGVDIPFQIQNILGLLLFAAIFLVIYFLNHGRNYDLKIHLAFNMRYQELDILYLFTATTFLFCYFSSVNVDYRLIFLAYPALKETITCTSRNYQYFFLFPTLILTFWFVDNSFFLQPIGDLALAFWAGQVLFRILIKFEILVPVQGTPHQTI